MKVLTITYNDLHISYGPAVHFLELWNNFTLLDKNYIIEGIAPNWIKDKKLIINPKFILKEIKVPNIGLLRQLIYDFIIILILLFKSKKYDIIYIRLSNFHIFSAYILKIIKIPYILELNGIARDDAKHSKRNKLYQFLTIISEKMMIKNAKGCIAVSDGIKDFAKECGCNNVNVIYNGVSANLFSIKNNSNKLEKIIYVGTFTAWDGHKKVFELAKKFPKIKFIIVGGANNLDDLIKKYSYIDNIEFTGFIEYGSLKEIYSNMDAGIVLYDKGFRNNMKLSSLKTLEYVASGLPIFSTNVPGQEFIFENNIGCEATENIEDDFQYMIDNYKSYKEQIEYFRIKFKYQISWEGVAKKTNLFIS